MKKIISLLIMIFGSIFFCNTSFALPVSYSTTTYIDQDKYNKSQIDPNELYYGPSWSRNYYNDSSGNNLPGTDDVPDPSSTFAETPDPGWINPKDAFDLSCWLASAANMLGYYPIGGAAPSTIYAELLGYGDGFYWWKSGLINEALFEYMTRNNLLDEFKITTYNGFTTEWPTNAYDIARQWLMNGATVSLGIYDPDDPRIGHAITLWGWDGSSIIFSDNEQDNPFGSDPDLHYADVDIFADTWFIYYDYFAWDNPTRYMWVNYITILSPQVPEPSTILLFVSGLVGIALLRKRVKQ